MCTGEIRERIQARRGLRGLSSGGYDAGGFVTKAMGLPGGGRRRSSRSTTIVADQSLLDPPTG